MSVPHLFVIVHVFTLNSGKSLKPPTCGVAQIRFNSGVVYLMCSAREHVCACASPALEGQVYSQVCNAPVV